MRTKIIVSCHKGVCDDLDPIVYQRKDIFVPIIGGANDLKDEELFAPLRSALKDNIGENISWANNLCSEATSLYWMYKHLDYFEYPDMVGLCHYRRAKTSITGEGPTGSCRRPTSWIP